MGVGGDFRIFQRFRPELVANPGFVTGSDQSWWRIRGLLPVQAGVGGDFRIFRDRVADLATGVAIIS